MDNYENPRSSEQSGGLPDHENSDNGDEKKRKPRKRIPLKPELQRPTYDDRSSQSRPSERRTDSDSPRYSRSEEFGPSVYEPRRTSLPERKQNEYSDRFNTDRPYTPRPARDDRPQGDRPYRERPQGDRPYGDRQQSDRPFGDRQQGGRSYGDRPQGNRPYGDRQQGSGRYPDSGNSRSGGSFNRNSDYQQGGRSGSGGNRSWSGGKPSLVKKGHEHDRPVKKQLRPRSLHDDSKRRTEAGFVAEIDGEIRLNKYISYAGICSRREADKLIEAGAVKVNGVIVTTLGSRVQPGDKVQYGDETLAFEKKYYVLLNKPKGYITTTEDPGQRKTVMQLVENACRERIYPVGRLDRNTTGLLLFTNDGLMAKKLMHPSGTIRKLYHVVLDNPLTHADIDTIAEGVKFDDESERVDIDDIAYAAEDKREIGIAIHSGQNRVVRRIFEKYGYKVNKLDRVMYAGLTKKNLGRGRWRYLSEQEVSFLKML